MESVIAHTGTRGLICLGKMERPICGLRQGNTSTIENKWSYVGFPIVRIVMDKVFERLFPMMMFLMGANSLMTAFGLVPEDRFFYFVGVLLVYMGIAQGVNSLQEDKKEST